MLGDICREARERAGITQREAAKEMGYSHQAVSRFERNEIYRVNPDMLLWYKKRTDAFKDEEFIWL